MKPESLRWTACLVLVSIIVSFQPGVAAFAPAGPASTGQGGPAPATLATLEGRLHLVWSDPRDQQGQGELLYLLIDRQGGVHYLDLSALALPFDQLLRLNGELVSLQALVPDDQRNQPPNPLPVQDILHAGDQPASLQAVLGNQPYVSILCKFNDVAVEPRNLAFFQGMYANSFPGLDHYWRELSYNQVNLLGSNAYGWFNLPEPRSYYIYDMNSDGDPDTDFDRLATDCTAAADASVYFPDFAGVNLMFNADLDGYSYGGGYSLSLDSPTPQDYGFTWMANWGYVDISMVEHEMGHSFGLPHSSGMYGQTYDNFWDVMSWDRHNGYMDLVYGRTGQHTISYHKDLLGWLTLSDKYTAPQDSLVHTITIEQLALPQTAGYEMAVLPVIGSTRFYTLEVRHHIDDNYDRNIDGFSVIIHEVDPGRENSAQVVDYDNNEYTRDAGAMWIAEPGIQETFIDASDGISVTLVSASTTSLTVDVRVGSPFPFTTCAAQTQMPAASCEALVALYNSTAGASWDRQDYWLGPEWPCRWFGVQCVENFGDVVSLFQLDYYLDLYNYGNNLAGSLPAEIGSLVNLESLLIRNDSLSGDIPASVCSLSSLKELNLGGNQLTGNIHSCLGSFMNLEYLDLDRNLLTGVIPPELGNISGLRSLNLYGNQLSGAIPPELGSLSMLQRLDLSHNQLNESIPASLGNLSNLAYGLFLNSNNLTGTIPPELGNLSKTYYLNLAYNQLAGGIPPQLGQMTSLQTLFLHNNQLAGNIPTELGNLANLYNFYAHENDLEGEIPASLTSLTNLNNLNLSSNHLSGVLPAGLFNMPNIDYLELSQNAFSGSLPENIGASSLYILGLANNQFVGEIPSSITTLTSLYNLNLGYNSLQSTNAAVIAFLGSKDSDWAQTQTVAPTNLQSAQQGADVRLTWTPILYIGDGGYYEISAASSPGGPFAVLGTTASKASSEFLAAGLGSGSHFFRLRTFTPQHYNQQSDLWSQYTTPLPYQAWAIFMPLVIQ